MLTSWQEIIIDTKSQSIHEFNRVCGFRLKENSNIYTTISSIHCKEANYSQEYGKYNRWFLSGTLFRGYLELDGQENLYLGENKIKKQMMKKLEKLANKLGVPVQVIPMNS